MDLVELKAAIDEHQAAVVENLDRAGADLKALAARLDTIEARVRRPLGGGDPSGRRDDITTERKAVGQFVATGSDAAFREVRGLEVGVDPAGGYFVLPAMSAAMSQRLWDLSPLRRLARLQLMSTGDAWQEPLDRGESSADWVGETEARPALATPAIGLLDIPLNEIYSSQPVTQKLLDLSFLDVGLWVEQKIVNKFARSEGEAFLTGDGIGKPRGILDHDIVATADSTRAADRLQYIASGQTSTIDADSLRSIYWGLRAPYRANATWMMSSATGAAIDKLKASTSGEYLWRPAMSAGEPPTLLGRPVEFDENMPAIGAGNYPVLLGDFQRGYIIIERPGLKMLRDPFSSKPNVVFYAYRRVGGGLADCDAIKVLKVATS